MKIGVIGTGYVGLVSGVCLSSKGHNVTCYDLSPEIIHSIESGVPHIFENGLERLMRDSIAAGNLKGSLLDIESLSDNDVIMIAVGTPSAMGKIDLTQIESAALAAGRAIAISKKEISVVVKSTVIPGTTDTFVKNIIERECGGKLFGLGMNPEFLREGNAVDDFMNPDRIVFGHEDQIVLRHLRTIYSQWDVPKLEVNSRTAELIKYANNFVLATLISTANEIANVCYEVSGVDSDQVMKGVYLDKRWSSLGSGGLPEILTYLYPGCGFGGSCFPKDVQAFRTLANDQGVSPLISQAVLDVNDEQPHRVSKMLNSYMNGLNGKRVLVLGLAFKPDTDDVRESPAAKIIQDLLKLGAKVSGHDPLAISNFKKHYPGLLLDYISKVEGVVADFDVVIVVTKWAEYRGLLQDLKLSNCVVVDLRRMYSSDEFKPEKYLSIGYRASQKMEKADESRV